MSTLTVSNVRHVRRGKLAALFNLRLGSILVRDCILWSDHLSRPLSVTGPKHRAHEGAPWIEHVAIGKELVPAIMEMVMSELAIQNKPKDAPKWISEFNAHDEEMRNTTPVRELTGPSRSTTRRKTFAELRSNAY